MAKPTVKKATVKLIRSIYINGSLVPATQAGKTKDAPATATVIDLPATLAAELVANSKAVLADAKEKANFSIAEPSDDDDLADI
jgi:hypothetical protein